ncbi:hybrid sensor histidine kinase/response regulator [Salinarimonas soli]|uniref:histidine kinase n=1 Tax=Salinarimonas soli TaxID=1638099 RepID=A0A5B2VTN4_9HYPH|nr:hybrid sensor histidine kinase/response regulator [Salinarimonas soli]KAA2242134.1 response regulator [Salinarimonas soli]
MGGSRTEADPGIVRPLRAMVVLSLLGPALLFGYAGYVNHESIKAQSAERIERALDVVQEHAAAALQTVERTIAETGEVLRGATDEGLRADEERLSRRLARSQAALPHIEAIWAFDRAGHPLVSSTVLPVPRGLDNSDRDYFQAQTPPGAGIHIGAMITARVGSSRFFVVSGRRETPDGAFDGVIAISVRPEHFRTFYARISRGIADSFGIVRADGAFLARFPSRGEGPERLNRQSVFLQRLAEQPEAGRFRATSQIDGIEREIGYRRVPGYPVYVQAGIETAAIWREWREAMLRHLAFGLPATLLLFGASLFALHRTAAFRAEVARRQAAEAALKQAQRLEAVGQLTGGVAHDFNNLLMVINGNVERLRRMGPDERQRRALEAIATAARRGASLTRQLLSFSRRQVHEPTVLDLRRSLPAVQDMLRSSLRGDIAVEIAVAPDLWPVKVDLSELELAILNIAVNARDAMPDGGRLTVAARNATLADGGVAGLRGDFVALSLTDTGCGIPPDVAARVFEPFFTTKEVGRGTGLGLSQVYGFAVQSGGTASLASEPGRGTTITLHLPRTREAPAAVDGAPESSVPRDGHGRVLLVEDNAAVAEVTVATLEELGYEVRHAADPAGALRLLEGEGRFDLVVSDIVMPGPVNGVDLARMIRTRHPHMPILLATGYSEVAQSAAEEGFPTLRKPYEAASLREAIRAALAGRRLRVVA